jgi:hypothetical protein
MVSVVSVFLPPACFGLFRCGFMLVSDGFRRFRTGSETIGFGMVSGVGSETIT